MAGRCVTLGTDAGIVYYPAISTRKRETLTGKERDTNCERESKPSAAPHDQKNGERHKSLGLLCSRSDFSVPGVERSLLQPALLKNRSFQNSRSLDRYSHGDNDNSGRFNAVGLRHLELIYRRLSLICCIQRHRNYMTII